MRAQLAHATDSARGLGWDRWKVLPMLGKSLRETSCVRSSAEAPAAAPPGQPCAIAIFRAALDEVRGKMEFHLGEVELFGVGLTLMSRS